MFRNAVILVRKFVDLARYGFLVSVILTAQVAGAGLVDRIKCFTKTFTVASGKGEGPTPVVRKGGNFPVGEYNDVKKRINYIKREFDLDNETAMLLGSNDIVFQDLMRNDPALIEVIQSMRSLSKSERQEILGRLVSKVDRVPELTFNTGMRIGNQRLSLGEALRLASKIQKERGISFSDALKYVQTPEYQTKISLDFIESLAGKKFWENSGKKINLESYEFKESMDIMVAGQNAQQVIQFNPELRGLTSEQQLRIRNLVATYQEAVEDGYSGANLGLKQTDFSDINANVGNLQATYTIDKFITQEEFRGSFWWDDAGAETISNKSSKGPPLLKSETGPNGARRIWWPKDGAGGAYYMGTKSNEFNNGLRLVENIDEAGNAKSMEVFALDSNGDWTPYFYRRVGNQWIPVQRIQNQKVRDFCFKCHGISGGKLSPFPNILDSKESLKAVGYSEDGAKVMMEARRLGIH